MDLITHYSCPNCKKCYQRYSFFSRHILTCNYSTISKTNTLPNTVKHPSLIQQQLDYLISSNMELRELVKKMQSEKLLEKRKIDILTWLNKNYTPEIDYIKFIETIELDNNYLNQLENNSVKIVIKQIFDNLFPIERENFSFKAFTIKINKIYVFKDSDGWKELTYDNIKQIISKISLQFLMLLKLWQEENRNKLSQNDISNTYLNLIKKINKININNNQFCNSIYRLLYEHLKIKSQIIEYQLI